MEYIVEESEPENEAKGTPSDATPDIDKGENSKEASEHPSEQFFPLRCFHCATVLCERVSNSDTYGFGPDGMPVIRAMCGNVKNHLRSCTTKSLSVDSVLALCSEPTWSQKSHSSVIIDQNFNPATASIHWNQLRQHASKQMRNDAAERHHCWVEVPSSPGGKKRTSLM